MQAVSFDFHRHYDDMMRQAYRDAESPFPQSKMSEHVKSAAKSARDAVDAFGHASVAFGAVSVDAAALGRALRVVADDAAPSLGDALALTPVEWTPIATTPKPPEPEPRRLTLPDGYTIGDVFADGEPVNATGIFNAPVGTVFCVDLGHGLIAVTRSCQYDLRDVWRYPQTRWGKVALLAQRAGEGHDVRIISHVATPDPEPSAPAPRMCGMVTPADVVATRDASPIGSDPMRFGWSSYE